MLCIFLPAALAEVKVSMLFLDGEGDFKCTYLTFLFACPFVQMQSWGVICCALLALVGAEECPDGARCKDGQTCCNDPVNGYECCPFDQVDVVELPSCSPHKYIIQKI